MTRLEALALAVPADNRCVADIGHDHGLLLASLLRARPALRVIGVELRAGADADFDARFATELAGWEGRVSLRRGDAFEVLGAGEADTVVMAGFGERAMLAAIDRGAELGRLPDRLVLCPAGFEVALRPGLLDRGWRFVEEELVEDGERFHEVIAWERGGVEPGSESERRWGPLVLRGPDPLLARFLEDTARRQAAALQVARDGAVDSPLLAKLALLDGLRSRLA